MYRWEAKRGGTLVLMWRPTLSKFTYTWFVGVV